MKKIVALLLALSMAFALCGCGKSEAVKNVEQEISSLSDTLTLDDAEAVSNVRATYNTLEEKEKGDPRYWNKP